MADEKITFQLDLDDAEFTASALKAKKNVEALGSSDNLKGLLDSLSKGTASLSELGGAASGNLSNLISIAASAAPVLAGLAVAGASIKAAFDLTMEAENIKAISVQFGILAGQAGLSASAMSEGLKKASGGLIEETELLKLANKAMLEMGNAAARLPELMEISRKAAVVLGQDAKSTFESLSQAIAMGNQRMLKHAGIMLDVNKVYRDYAASIGVTATALNESGKQHALMNAVIEKAKVDLAGINPDIKEAANEWQKLKVTIEELSKAFAVAFNVVMGDAVKGWLILLNQAGDSMKNFFAINFGDPVDKAKASVNGLGAELGTLASLIVENQNKLEAGKKNGFNWWESDEQSLQHTISNLQAQFDKVRALKQQQDQILKQDEAKNAASEAANTKKPDAGGQIDRVAQQKQEAKFQEDMQKLAKETYTMKVGLVNSYADIDVLLNQRILDEAQRNQTVYKQIDAQKAAGEITSAQAAALTAQENEMHELKMRQLARDTEAERIKLLQDYQKNATTTFQGVARAAQSEAEQQKHWLTDAGIQGKFIFDSLATAGVDAFDALGRGAANGSFELKQALLGALGSVCSSYGKAMMLASLWPFDPLVFSAGAALVVLGGYISASSSAGSSGPDVSSSAPTSPGLSASNAAQGGTLATAVAPNTDQTGPKSVSINIEGNYFDTDQTRLKLIDLIRQSSDATDYQFRKIGQ